MRAQSFLLRSSSNALYISLCFSQYALSAARNLSAMGVKLIIPDAVHTDLYDGGGKDIIPFDKLVDFFTKYLK